MPINVEKYFSLKENGRDVNNMVEKDLEDLPGVGPSIAEKLREAGYTDIMEIATATPQELSTIAEVGVQVAARIIAAAKDLAEIGSFVSAKEVYEQRKKLERISTGSSALDGLLGGGVQTGAITEFYGEFGTGKTQISHQLCVNVQLPKDQGGLEGEAIFIDTENTFRPERIHDMAEQLKLDPEKVMNKIHYARAYNSNYQMLLIEKAKEIAKNHPIKLLVVDSLTAYFRSEYVGRGMLADRQQQLNRHMHDLLRFADVFNAAIVCTNQVTARPDVLFGGGELTKPIGGNIVSHSATYIVYLRKGKGDKRIAKLTDSPDLPEDECAYMITQGGIKDIPS